MGVAVVVLALLLLLALFISGAVSAGRQHQPRVVAVFLALAVLLAALLLAWAAPG